MIRINLLPHRAEKRKRSRQHFMVMAGVAAAIGVGIVAMVHVYYAGRIATQAERNEFLKKENAKLDLWLPDLGPSTELRKWFNHDLAKWDEFRSRYHAELKAKTVLLATITEQAKTRPVTLLYSAKDEQCNQAVALRDFLGQRKGIVRQG